MQKLNSLKSVFRGRKKYVAAGAAVVVASAGCLGYLFVIRGSNSSATNHLAAKQYTVNKRAPSPDKAVAVKNTSNIPVSNGIPGSTDAAESLDRKLAYIASDKRLTAEQAKNIMAKLSEEAALKETIKSEKPADQRLALRNFDRNLHEWAKKNGIAYRYVRP